METTTAPTRLPYEVRSAVRMLGEGWHVRVLPNYGTLDPVAWLKQHGTLTQHVGWQHYTTVTYFDHIGYAGSTKHSSRALAMAHTEAGEFMVVGPATRAFRQLESGQRISFSWWRSGDTHLVDERPEVLTPAREDHRPEGTPWSLYDYGLRLADFPITAGRLRYYSPIRWARTPERIKFGCIK